VCVCVCGGVCLLKHTSTDRLLINGPARCVSGVIVTETPHSIGLSYDRRVIPVVL